MRILVVGGAGYIGSHVVRALLDYSHHVTVFDNLSTGHKTNLFPEATFIQGDILDTARLQASFSKGFDAIIHLAALKAAGESMEQPEKYATNNISGTIGLLNATVAAGTGIFIFSSSAAVYGSPQYLPIDERHPTNPENFYGFTKLEIERILAWYDRIKGLRFCALRYFNAAGYDPQERISGLERNPANLLPIVMEAAAGLRPKVDVYGNDYKTRDGTGLRDYIHVTDLAQAHCAALDYVTKNRTSLMVNLGSEKGITVKEMIEHARVITRRPIPTAVVGRRAGDPAEVLASSKKAYEILGWKPVLSDVETLIRTTWNVYLKKMQNAK